MSNDLLARMGGSVAPPRFILFAFVLVLSLTVVHRFVESGFVVFLVAFDCAALVFLLSLIPLLDDKSDEMRITARTNDANRVGLLLVTTVVSAAVLVAIGALVIDPSGLTWRLGTLIVASLFLSWLFANAIFTLHYAHLFYHPSGGGDLRGMEFPNSPEPDYWDFAYFSFNLGMTFQTSDVSVTLPHVRRVVLGQSIAAYIFNIGIIAFAVNSLGG